jgi:CRISPR-associated protein Cas1
VKRHLNTLFVTTQGAYLAKEGETAVVRSEGETLLRVPLLNLDGIVCFGNVGTSPFLLGACGERGVAVSYLSSRGRFLARVVGPVSGNVLLRREQYRRADDPEGAAAIARSIVLAKVINSRRVLQRSLRDQPAEGSGRDSDPRAEAVAALAALAREVERASDLDAVRGLEGTAARTYFAAFPALILPAEEAFAFRGRNRRPPLDPVNALLSFVYTLLRHDVTSALEATGLDPQVGFLHRDRSGRSSLALDLMEELRAPLGDRLVLSLINRRQVRPDGFEVGESGGVFMDEATRKTVLVAYQERKQAEVTHPFLGETTSLGLLFQLQARLLARHLRGDLDAYPPYVPR